MEEQPTDHKNQDEQDGEPQTSSASERSSPAQAKEAGTGDGTDRRGERDLARAFCRGAEHERSPPSRRTVRGRRYVGRVSFRRGWLVASAASSRGSGVRRTTALG